MTTIVNSSTPTNDSKGYGFLIGVVAIIVFAILFIYFVLPAIRNTEPIQINVPAPQINMPDKVDVNIDQTK